VLGGIYKVLKGKEKKVRYAEKKRKKRKPITVNSKVFIGKKEGKECSVTQAKKNTIFISKK